MLENIIYIYRDYILIPYYLPVSSGFELDLRFEGEGGLQNSGLAEWLS